MCVRALGLLQLRIGKSHASHVPGIALAHHHVDDRRPTRGGFLAMHVLDVGGQLAQLISDAMVLVASATFEARWFGCNRDNRSRQHTRLVAFPGAFPGATWPLQHTGCLCCWAGTGTATPSGTPSSATNNHGTRKRQHTFLGAMLLDHNDTTNRTRLRLELEC